MNEEYQRRLQDINARIDKLNYRTAKSQPFDVQKAARTGQTITNTPDYTKTIERLEANKKARQEPINPRESVSTGKSNRGVSRNPGTLRFRTDGLFQNRGRRSRFPCAGH